MRRKLGRRNRGHQKSKRLRKKGTSVSYERQEQKQGRCYKCKIKGRKSIQKMKKKQETSFISCRNILGPYFRNPTCCSWLYLAHIQNTPLYNEFPPFILAPSLLLYRMRPPEVTEENWFLIKLLHTRAQKLSHNVVHNENWHHQMALVSLFSFFLDVMDFFWHLHIWL